MLNKNHLHLGKINSQLIHLNINHNILRILDVTTEEFVISLKSGIIISSGNTGGYFKDGLQTPLLKKLAGGHGGDSVFINAARPLKKMVATPRFELGTHYEDIIYK